MKALIYKDLMTLKKTLLFVLVLSIAIGSVGVYHGYYIILAGLAIVLPILLMTSSSSYDMQANFEVHAFSMPLKKRDYFLSKLVYALAFGLAGALVTLFFLYRDSFEREVLVLAPLLILLTTLLISALLQVLVIKFGAVRGRYILMAAYIGLFILFNNLAQDPELLISIIEKAKSALAYLGLPLLAFIITFIGLVLVLLMVNIGSRILVKKDF